MYHKISFDFLPLLQRVSLGLMLHVVNTVHLSPHVCGFHR